MKKIVTFLASVLFSFLIYSQPANKLNFSFNHVALSVKDVNAAAAFYKNILGLEEITNKTKVDGIRWFSLGEGKELHLLSVVKEPVIVNKAVHFALTTSNFAELISHLEKKKVVYLSWAGEKNKITIRADGIQQIYIQDTDGYWIEINSVGE